MFIRRLEGLLCLLEHLMGKDPAPFGTAPVGSMGSK